MSDFVAPRRRGLVFALLACLVVALGGLVMTPASALNTAPATIVIDSVTSDVAVPSGLAGGAAPYVVVKAGGTFHINVSFKDSTGAPTSFNNDTTLTIASNVGTLTRTTGIAPRNSPTATLDTALTGAVNQVVLTVSAGSGPKAPTPGTSYVPDVKDLRFDVLSDLKPDLPSTDGTAFQQGIGGDADCTNATKAAPVCEIVILPRGAGSNVLMSVGACDTDTNSSYAPCFTGPKGAAGGAIVQALFAQPGTPYSPTAPVTVVVKCDKTLCGTGPIQNLTLTYSLLGNGALADAGPCPAKGTTDAAGTPCVDYVQSKRDGSGDTHLYFLTPGDLRVGVG
jgi:hypothetical protein